MEYNFLTYLFNFGSQWKIVDVKIDEILKEVDVFFEYTDKTCYYNDSEKECVIYDYTKSRRLRHMDLLDYATYINFRTPRAKLSNGSVRKIPLPFADFRVSFTYLFEIKVIETLQLSKNQTHTASYLKTTFEIIHNIMERSVARGLKKRNLDDVRVLSLDEKSVFNGHNYITVLSNPINKSVIDIIEGRSVESVKELIYNNLTEKQQATIDNVTMDMWKPYITCVKELMPQASIVHDNFHTMKYLNAGVDETRKQEVKNNEELKKTKYIFLKNPENLTDNQQDKFDEINAINLKTSKAWQIKENFKQIYNYWTTNACANYFKNWYMNVIDSEIKPMIKVADTILNHIEGVINAAVTTLSNAIAENINSKIQIIKAVGRGFKNINGYRNSILFFNGNLDLLPL